MTAPLVRKGHVNDTRATARKSIAVLAPEDVLLTLLSLLLVVVVAANMSPASLLAAIPPDVSRTAHQH